MTLFHRVAVILLVLPGLLFGLDSNSTKVYDTTTSAAIGNDCPPGFYGNECNVPCSANCTDLGCERNNGSCIECYQGSHGEYCNETCPEHCSQNCSRSGYCIKCDKGYYNMHSDVEADCSDIPENRRPFLCDCSVHCPGCTSDRCGISYGCTDTCRPGYFGKFCEKTCPKNCFACHHKTGECLICETGFNGTYCNETCPKDSCINPFNNPNEPARCPFYRYGVNCSQFCGDYFYNCKSPSEYFNTCNRYTGVCEFGCKYGRYGPHCENLCGSCAETFPYKCMPNGSCTDQGCAGNYYGDKCDKNCPEHCSFLGCNRTTGVCHLECDSGYYGEYCNFTCPEHCSTTDCNRLTGACLYGCSFGYKNLPNCTDVNDYHYKSLSLSGGLIGVIVASILVVLGLLILTIYISVTRHLQRPVIYSGFTNQNC